MQSITLQLFPATFSLPAAIQFQVSGDGSSCFVRSGEKKTNLGKVEKSPYRGLSPTRENDESGASFAESSWVARSGRHTDRR